MPKQTSASAAGKARLRRLLKEGALRHAERDLKLAEEWSSLDDTLSREEQE
jgi:hypothetical protein